MSRNRLHESWQLCTLETWSDTARLSRAPKYSLLAACRQRIINLRVGAAGAHTQPHLRMRTLQPAQMRVRGGGAGPFPRAPELPARDFLWVGPVSRLASSSPGMAWGVGWKELLMLGQSLIIVLGQSLIIVLGQSLLIVLVGSVRGRGFVIGSWKTICYISKKTLQYDYYKQDDNIQPMTCRYVPLSTLSWVLMACRGARRRWGDWVSPSGLRSVDVKYSPSSGLSWPPDWSLTGGQKWLVTATSPLMQAGALWSIILLYWGNTS